MVRGSSTSFITERYLTASGQTRRPQVKLHYETCNTDRDNSFLVVISLSEIVHLLKSALLVIHISPVAHHPAGVKRTPPSSCGSLPSGSYWMVTVPRMGVEEGMEVNTCHGWPVQIRSEKANLKKTPNSLSDPVSRCIQGLTSFRASIIDVTVGCFQPFHFISLNRTWTSSWCWLKKQTALFSTCADIV